MKRFYESKTFWFNVVALLVYAAHEYFGVESFPVPDPGVIALVNLALRFVTKTRIGAA